MFWHIYFRNKNKKITALEPCLQMPNFKSITHFDDFYHSEITQNEIDPKQNHNPQNDLAVFRPLDL